MQQEDSVQEAVDTISSAKSVHGREDAVSKLILKHRQDLTWIRALSDRAETARYPEVLSKLQRAIEDAQYKEGANRNENGWNLFFGIGATWEFLIGPLILVCLLLYVIYRSIGD